MKFSEIREEYYTHTGKASDVIRQLAYAGFGVLWVFKVGTSLPGLPKVLLPSALCFTLTLLFDVAQYVRLARAWSHVAAKADEATETVEDEYPVEIEVNRSGIKFYNSKVYSLIAGYVLLALGIVFLLFQ